MAKKRGLGRSLDALLIGSNSHADEEGNLQEKLCQLSFNQIQRGKYQPRRGMDPEALEDLANSIRAQGIIQPIVVRQVLDGRYEIIAGERRWRAAQMAGLNEVPAIIKDIPDEAAIAIALIENIQRENLNPIEEAIALQRLMDEFALTHHQVAESVGKSRTTVTNTLRLLSLCEDVKGLLEQGDIEMGHARALLTLSEDLQIEAARKIVENQLNVRDAEELARRLQIPDLTNTPKPIDPDIQRLQTDLTHRLHLPVKIRCNSKGKGKLVVYYKNLAELESVLDFFNVEEEH